MTPHHKLPVPVFHLFDSIGRAALVPVPVTAFDASFVLLTFYFTTPLTYIHTYNCSSTAILRLFYHYTLKEISSDCVAVYFDCFVVKDIIIDTSRDTERERERPSFATLWNLVGEVRCANPDFISQCDS